VQSHCQGLETVGVFVEQESEKLLRFPIASVPAVHMADAGIEVARLACCSDVKVPKGEPRNGSVAVAETSSRPDTLW